MSDKSYIYHHLGLGDHLICDGLVRKIVNANPWDKLQLVVKNKNFNNVSRMYSDLPELTFFKVDKDQEFVDFCDENKAWDKVFKIGFELCRAEDFDKSFYDCVGMPFHHRWDSWGLERDYEQEAKITAELNIQGDYIFVHDESSVGDYNLNIKSSLRQVKPDRLKSEQSIFDWMGVIENAKEVHGISSSFTHLIDSMELKNELYFHNIKASHGMGFTLKNNWEIVNYD